MLLEAEKVLAGLFVVLSAPGGGLQMIRGFK